MKRFAAAFLALVLALGAVSAAAQERKGVIAFAVEPNWPPLEFLDPGGQVVGYAVDYFRAVCRESGYEAEFVKTPWEEIFKGLDAGHYDAIMSSVTVTPERRKAMDFTIPYYIVRQSLVVPQGSSVTDIRQLKDLKVGTQDGTTATEIVGKVAGAVSTPFPDIESAMAALVRGEIDAVICEDVVASSFLRQPDFAGKIKMASVIDTPGAEELYAVAVRKGNLRVLVALNDGVKAVRAKGLETELRRKWLAGAGQ